MSMQKAEALLGLSVVLFEPAVVPRGRFMSGPVPFAYAVKA